MVDDDELYLSVLVIGEIRRGIERLRKRDSRSAQHLESWLMRIKAQFGDRILAIGEEIGELWGELGLEQPVPPIDGLLAASALYHNMTLVTRNTDDVERTGVALLNPFTE